VNRTALTSITPEVFGKRLISERYFRNEAMQENLRAHFDHVQVADHQAATF
jgi:hypothetical protein